MKASISTRCSLIEASMRPGRLSEPAVVGQRLHAAVKDVVGAVVAVHIARGGAALEFVVQPLQLGQLGISGLGGGFERAAAFQQRHHRKQLVGIVVGQLDDAAAALRHQLHQALGGQHLQRLAQRRAADQPLLGQGLFVDPLARRQLALEDHGAQPRRHAVVQRSTAKGDGICHT
jgi:hypothetical protein